VTQPLGSKNRCRFYAQRRKSDGWTVITVDLNAGVLLISATLPSATGGFGAQRRIVPHPGRSLLFQGSHRALKTSVAVYGERRHGTQHSVRGKVNGNLVTVHVVRCPVGRPSLPDSDRFELQAYATSGIGIDAAGGVPMAAHYDKGCREGSHSKKRSETPISDHILLLIALSKLNVVQVERGRL
jgi:hypothetical protein